MIAILLFRRTPPLLLLYRFVPEIHSWKEALFSGHFDGCGRRVRVNHGTHTAPLPPVGFPGNPQQMFAATIEPIVSFVILGSILVHGLSIPFFNVGREFARNVTTTSTSNRAAIDLEACGKTEDSGSGGIVVRGKSEAQSLPVTTTREEVAICRDRVEGEIIVSVGNSKVCLVLLQTRLPPGTLPQG
ncbi:hypothetical protein PISMIDRAFT_151450 [Pisolithus microcarpus 441]|uniref:Uncharacterized protein n=1 Tax=Pisolithus microcarpus 441 TaxID=765257 RepID=A0A0C9ZPR9_9AGAM|nr:hypothetical protein PISMIDRAFT_151450 [Pisolithus microcarpus 441]